LQRIGKIELPEPILVRKSNFSTEIKWNFFVEQPLLTEAEIGSTEDLEIERTWFSHTKKNVG
jgi:hypothetical protein